MFVWLVYTGVYQSAWLINEQILSLGLKSFGWHVMSRCGMVGRVPMRNLICQGRYYHACINTREVRRKGSQKQGARLGLALHGHGMHTGYLPG